MSNSPAYKIEQGAMGLKVTRITPGAPPEGRSYGSDTKDEFYFSDWIDAQAWLAVELSGTEVAK